MPDGGASIWLPLIIGSAVSTGGSLYAGSKAGAAADLQATAGERALAFQKQMYQDAVTRTTPYVNNGTSANNALAKLMGLGTGGPLGGTPNTPAALPPGGLPTEGPPVMDVRNTAMDREGWNPLDAIMSTASTPTPAPPPGGAFSPSAAVGGNTLSAPAAGSMVTMISPDGQDRQVVPKSQVAYYQRRGATIAPGAAA